VIYRRASVSGQGLRVLLLDVMAVGLLTVGACAASLPSNSWPVSDSVAAVILLLTALVVLWDPLVDQLARSRIPDQSALVAAAGIALPGYSLSGTHLLLWPDGARSRHRWLGPRRTRCVVSSRLGPLTRFKVTCRTGRCSTPCWNRRYLWRAGEGTIMRCDRTARWATDRRRRKRSSPDTTAGLDTTARPRPCRPLA
jgi:hypothetical protein